MSLNPLTASISYFLFLLSVRVGDMAPKHLAKRRNEDSPGPSKRPSKKRGGEQTYDTYDEAMDGGSKLSGRARRS